MFTPTMFSRGRFTHVTIHKHILPDILWVFRNVVFQDVGFEHIGFEPLKHIGFRCEVPTPSLVEGQSTIMFKPHVLEHHIPELPNTDSYAQSPY